MVVPAGRRLIVFIERDEDALSDRLSQSLTNALRAQVCACGVRKYPSARREHGKPNPDGAPIHVCIARVGRVCDSRLTVCHFPSVRAVRACPGVREQVARADAPHRRSGLCCAGKQHGTLAVRLSSRPHLSLYSKPQAVPQRSSLL